MFIGPPGVGQDHGADQFGPALPACAATRRIAAIGGVGGTRNCDWWFADEAVLIDTAGRYTTQDSDAAVDQAGWQGFLDLLKRSAARQPLNGVVVAIRLADIAALAEARTAAHARAIRRRINELTTSSACGCRSMRVHQGRPDRRLRRVLRRSGREEREQVWGMTFPLDKPESGSRVRSAEFRRLLARLNERMLERLQAERSAERRALIYGFPLQVAILAQPLSEFLSRGFGGSRLDARPAAARASI